MDDVLTQQPVVGVTDTAAVAQPTATDIYQLNAAVKAIVAEQVRVHGVGVDVTQVMPGYLTAAIATVVGNQSNIDPLTEAKLRVMAQSQLSSEYGQSATTQAQSLNQGATTVAEIAGNAFVNYTEAGVPGYIAATAASSIAGENAPAVVTTNLLLNADVFDEETHTVVAPTLTATAEAMWNTVNSSSDPEQGFNSAKGILVAGIGNAVAQAQPGTKEHETLLEMHRKALDNEFDGVVRDIAKSPWSDTGLGDATEKSFDRLAGKLDAQDPEKAGKIRSAGKFVAARHAPDNENVLVTMGKNVIGLGGVAGGAAVISGLLGDGEALNRIADGTIKPGQSNALASQMFQHELIKKYPGMKLFGDDSKWANAFNTHYFGATGESSVLASGRNINWQPIGGSVAYHNDSNVKKFMMVAGMMNPLTFGANFLTGKLPQQAAWIGTGFGKNMNRPEKHGWMAKASIGLMQNKFYQGTAKVFLTTKAIFSVPIHMGQDAFSVIAKFLNDRATAPKGGKSANDTLKRDVLGTVLWSVVSGGTLTLGSFAYTAVNWVTNGMLDKVVWGTIKTTIAVVLIVVVIITLITTNFLGTLTSGKLELYQLHGYSSSGILPYEKNYRPILVQRTEDPTTEPGPGANCQNGKVVELPEANRIHPKFSPRRISTHEYNGSTGIDVSHWNGSIDWNTVGNQNSPKITFAIMKATEGTSYKKEYRDLFAQWFKASKGNVNRTAYHFFRPDEDGYSQANYFMNTIYDAGGGDFGEFQVALDVEMTDYLNLDCGLQLSTDNIKAFLDQVEKMLGYKAIIYTSNSQWQALTTQPSWSGDYPLWVAAWNSGTAPGTLPKGWNDWLIWQYSASGSVPGISSAKVDMNRWRK